MNDLKFETEYIVVGSGIAGLRAAIDLAQAGPVTIFTKAETTESNSIYAQGGIAAAVGPGDDPQRHYDDTLKAGAGLSEPQAVRVLVEEGPREIERLLDWGADFEKDGQALSLSREGGHSLPRIVHGNGGLTGKVVVDALLAKIQALANVRIIPFTMFRDLIVDGDRVIGIEYEDAGGIGACHSRSTLVATGGGSQVYQESTNPQTATGDGLAAAYRAGADLRDMEFIQFHPTVLNIPGAPRFLLTEALRGESAHIVNESGARFVDELSTRDEVSRAVYRQLTARPGGKVFLDVKHIAPEIIRKKFRHVYTTCLQYGLDIMQQPISITPAAHYFMGGIRTDLSGRTSLGGLYAAGEVASTGVHGANRLASNSLLEALVFGGRAAAAMREEPPADGHSGRVMRANSGAPSFADSVARIQDTTWRYAGLVRNAAGLGKGIEILTAIEAAGEQRTQNLLAVSRVILESALARQESRGAHYRDDFPSMGPGRLHSYSRKGQPVVLR